MCRRKQKREHGIRGFQLNYVWLRLFNRIPKLLFTRFILFPRLFNRLLGDDFTLIYSPLNYIKKTLFFSPYSSAALGQMSLSNLIYYTGNAAGPQIPLYGLCHSINRQRKSSSLCTNAFARLNCANNIYQLFHAIYLAYDTRHKAQGTIDGTRHTAWKSERGIIYTAKHNARCHD